MDEPIDEAFAAPLSKRRPVEETVVVVGAGTMGAGIAFVAALAGYTVDLIEPDRAMQERAQAFIATAAERAGDAGVAGRVRYHASIPERSDAAIAIEAVSERLDVKRAVFAALARSLPPHALLATNTSSLPVEALAESVPQPERVVGVHFFNPPVAMKLVEVVHAPATSDEAIERACAFVARLGKTAVLAADTPGFIVNRVARPYYLQSMRALAREVASVPELDALARAAGFRMGPFELMDLIGLDVNLATSESVYERTGAERLMPAEMQREMVSRGRLGRKSGAGFYDYSEGPPDRADLGVELPEGERRDELVAVVGFGGLADELAERLESRFARVQRIENDELLDEVSPGATIVIDVGNGTADRGDAIAALDALLAPQTLILVDAYATAIDACARRLRHPDRLVGFGVLGSFESQRAVEIVDSQDASDEALAQAQTLFEALGKGVVLVEDVPGLFLGRVVGSIVNEAVIAVHENVAAADDVDLAMRLGTNYPIGPIAWGREIGGARLTRVLRRLADAEGEAFAPHRSLWVLDVEEEGEAAPVAGPASPDASSALWGG